MSEQPWNKKLLHSKPLSRTEEHDFLMTSVAKHKTLLMKWTIDDQELSELRIRNYKYTRIMGVLSMSFPRR